MKNETTPISREALLEEANRIIRSHEDFIHGMEATDVEQKGNVLVFRGSSLWTKTVCQRQKQPLYLICLNI